MTKRLYSSIILILLVLSACKPATKKDKPINPDWIKRNLNHGWTCYTPKGFVIKDTMVGGNRYGIALFYKNGDDSVSLVFSNRSGDPILVTRGKMDCSLKAQTRRAKSEVNNDDEDYYGEKNRRTNYYVDTIDNKIALIRVPKQAGEDLLTHIEIRDCEKDESLSMSAKGLSEPMRKLVVEIFGTIRRDNKK